MKSLFLLMALFPLIAVSQNVGVGTNTPTEKLEVNGNVKSDTAKANVLKLAFNAAIGKVLSSDAAGNAGWTSSNTLPGTIASSGRITASVGNIIPAAYNVYEFVGTYALITVNGNQRIIANGLMNLGRSSTANGTFDTDMGYQSVNPVNGSLGPITPFATAMHVLLATALQRIPIGITGNIKLPAGTYRIGAILKGSESQVNYNDYMNVSYMIVNE